MSKTKVMEKDNSEILHAAEIKLADLMDNPFEGIMVINNSGIIIYINSFFAELFKTSKDAAIGQKSWDVVPNCKLIETVKQGYSIWGETLKINEKELLVYRYPIKKEGTVVGAVIKTIFPDMTIAKEVSDKISRSLQQMDCLNQRLCTCRDIIGETPSMLYVKKLARRASRTSSTLLITGESGTGKEVIAQAIHTRSVRREAPFISVNCGAIPENLLESELFGYVDGAFTGAKRGGKPGKFELASGGTILLDEIGDMPLFMQVKILRVLQDREVWRIGATIPTKLDVRVMASTNQDLKRLVKEKKFREDLYYRLNVLEINMPSLRERLEDLPILVEELIKRINNRIGSDAVGISLESLEIMKQYSWPGNVRELENLLEQAVNWSDDPVIDIRNIREKPWERDTPHFAKYIHERGEENPNDINGYRSMVDETEKTLILNALTRANGNKAHAARLLNIQRSVLYKKLDRLNIS